ncbi:hypothetical protein ACIQ7D_18015 [Streptomyces sp. NPDC096310]|uniref:zinc finger domain-containing protein n=1 Tax=Streptomyces sp. NPDC096310 TaxID=3366082 RepID=UPI0037FB19AD
MTRHIPAPMPASLRPSRIPAHAARGVVCPWCRAQPGSPCVIPSSRRRTEQVHQQRMAAWAQTVACCTTCQVEPTVPCHLDGWPLKDGAVHPARHTEAEVTAA